ncbi:hypothetical protein [Winogradskyella luteola]|uniref:Uncharacterized protein n=1 Tax=Winogradskyella luteola TaxID=2828330 RepID=A0A9X1F6R5_9FLAO|nr:hypothetical protein [Winogradskyella luteola]MBV7268407.1 hypothetical protein [Winogradskyella luteola]
MRDLEYKLEKIAIEHINLPPYFRDTRIFIQECNPYINEMQMALVSYIASRKLGEEEVLFYPKRQSFWDYILFRKPKPFKVKVSAKDILRDVPELPRSHDVIRLYEIEKINIVEP